MDLKTTISPSVEFGLRAIGIWPGSRSILFRTFWTISLGLAQTFQFKYIVACIETANFLDLIDSVSTTLPYSLLCLKLIILWQNQKLFNDILTSMSRDWRNCDAVAFDVRIMTNKATLSHRCSMLIIGVYSIAVVVYVSVIMEFNSINSESGRGELFLKMEFPFVYEFSPIYEIVMFTQFVQLLSNASVIGILNALIITLSIESNKGFDMLLKSLFFYIAITLEAFIFCFAGEYLSNKSKSVANAAYEALWYDAKPSESRNLVILILRSQKRLTLTIGKFNDLSLEVFASLILWEIRAAIVRKSRQELTLVLSGFVNEEIKKRGFLCEMIPTSTVSRPVEIGLRLTGIWPNSSIFFRLLWTLVMGTGLIFQYHYLLIHFSIKELPNLIDGLSTTLPYNLLFFKLVVLWVNNRLFIDILTAMSNDWSEYSNIYAMIDKAILAHRCSKVTIGVYSTAVLLYSTASINFRKQTNGSCRELLIKMELPFEFCNSPIYEIVECVQFVHLMAVASAIGMLDALMVTLMLHIGGQIDLMQQEVEEICPKNNKYNLPTTILKSLINKHHKIIAFSENIESLFSHIALMQFFSNTLIICCIGFLIVTSMGTDEGVRMLVKTLFFYIAITLEAFIFCFAGIYLSNKSRTIGDAVYESVWYTLKPRDCRILLLVIMRSQKCLTITAGKFMDLSLEGFTNVSKYYFKYDNNLKIRIHMTTTSTVALVVQIGLRGIGFWPNTPCALLFRCLWILTIGIVQTLQYWWIVIHFRTDDMSHLMDGLSVTIEYSVMSLKLIILWFNSRIFYDVLAAMATDWREATSSEMNIMMSKANLSRRISNIIVTLHAASFVCFGIEVLASYTDDYDDDETLVRVFTLKLQLPSQCNESPLYELVTGLEFFHQLAASTTTGVLNSLLITLILHTSGQIEILCDILKNISSEMNNQQLAFSMKKVIGKHQKIITFSDKIEKIFSYIALIQFMSSTLLTCCIGFTIITSIDTQDSDTIDGTALMKAVVFYIAAAVEAFIFCFCGEYLTAKSKMIGDAAYKSVWYDFTPKESKLVLLIILRSQRRLTITAGNMMDLSLEGFTNMSRRDNMITSTVALWVQIGLRSIGFWPNTPCALLFRCLWILTIGIVQTFQYWWIIIHLRTDDMSYLMDGLSVTIEYSVMSLKLIILWFNSRIFYNVLAAMAADWREATSSEMHIMMSKANLSRRFSNVIIGLHSVAVMCFGIEVLASHTNDADHGIETPVRAFTLKLQLPLRCNESPLYELVMSLEFLHQLAASTTTGVLNSLLITLSINTQDSDTVDGTALMKAVVFYIAAAVEAFTFCFCGEYLTAKSKMIGDAAYKSVWYDFTPKESKLVLLIILRSQRRLTITAGNMMDLSLEGFTSILKASVSYVSVLHAMY
ncbi:PREDICTED: uncharacterized protein LOC108752420 [Trachymyrmex septentrionalis]|uniref:uncharacterized protein LOC108752420 n=1 Tax=Trachymyrmex septentrionalis TaxID=34720 RepID=UPI00084F256F|nr:PREDICTED: uncharacterized protein LOC108752420 [Trachymyrmex septentrionalis]